MKFNYAAAYPSEKEKIGELDTFLEKLSEEYPEEFKKQMYMDGRFMGFGISSDNRAIIYRPNDQMPEYIEKAIYNKIMELWPLKRPL